MLKKGNKLYSILTGSCPKCHSESMYTNNNPYVITMLFDMYERCSHCDTKYKLEPSFFFGSMYVSYGVGILFAAIPFAISSYFFEWSLLQIFLSVVATLLILLPVIVRLSRNIWINFFIKYDPTKATKP